MRLSRSCVVNVADGGSRMDLLDRQLEHDRWATAQLLDLSRGLTAAQLDHEFDVGHRTLRATFEHMIFSVAFWTASMTEQPVSEPGGCLAGLRIGHRPCLIMARRAEYPGAWSRTLGCLAGGALRDWDDTASAATAASAVVAVLNHAGRTLPAALFVFGAAGAGAARAAEGGGAGGLVAKARAIGATRRARGTVAGVHDASALVVRLAGLTPAAPGAALAALFTRITDVTARKQVRGPGRPNPAQANRGAEDSGDWSVQRSAARGRGGDDAGKSIKAVRVQVSSPGAGGSAARKTVDSYPAQRTP
jgi:hypothetical protein